MCQANLMGMLIACDMGELGPTRSKLNKALKEVRELRQENAKLRKLLVAFASGYSKTEVTVGGRIDPIAS